MSQVITFENYKPSPRYDSLAWTDIEIQEGTTADGPWTTLETQNLTPVDADPSDPAARNFTTELASDDPDLWYRVVFFDASGDESQPTVPVQNSTPSIGSPYASVTELARILKIRAPSTEQEAAMRRVLVTAAGEIDSEIDLDSESSLSGWQLALAEEVNLERAVEHWRQQESPFGLTGLSADMGPTLTARDSWSRHALKLAPLKSQWGLA